MTRTQEPALIINSGGLSGLIATWGEARGSMGRAAVGSDGAATGSVLYVPDDDRPQRTRRLMAIARQAELCGLGEPIEHSPLTLTSVASAGRVQGAAEAIPQDVLASTRTSAMLLSACVLAAARGIERVIWPVHIGGTGRSEDHGGLSVDELMGVCDRALLVSQLVSLDLPRTGGRMGVRVQTPYVDFSDAQMMDLAMDMDVPLSACWWCLNDQPEACGQCGQCLRWRQALSAVDPSGAVRLEELARQVHARA